MDDYQYLDYDDYRFLEFPTKWLEKLPPESSQDGFICVLVDMETGVEYSTRVYVAYYEGDDTTMVSSYYYSEHHCQCHRKGYIARDCGVDLGGECEGERIKIKKLYAPDFPIILYSEILTEDELEKIVATVEK